MGCIHFKVKSQTNLDLEGGCNVKNKSFVIPYWYSTPHLVYYNGERFSWKNQASEDKTSRSAVNVRHPLDCCVVQ